MSTIVTRVGKGSPLTNAEVDANFTNLNTDKIEADTSVTLTNKTLTTPVINGFTGDTTAIDIGSGQIVKDVSGNVGIGTNVPGSRLDVKGTLRLSGSSSGYSGFSVAAAAGSTVYTLPATDGDAFQVLSTNGSGGLAWVSAASGSAFGFFVEDYGVVGDGVTDDLAALQACATAAGAAGGYMIFKGGIHRITDTLSIPYNCAGVLVLGFVVIEADFASAVRGIDYGDSTHDISRPMFGVGPGRLTVQRKVVPTWGDGTSHALRMYNCKIGSVGNVLFYRWDGGVEMYANASGLAGGSTGGCFSMRFDQTEFFNVRRGVIANSQSSGNSGSNGHTFISCRWVGLSPGTTLEPVIAVHNTRGATGDKNANQWEFINCSFELNAARWGRSVAYSIGDVVTAEVTSTYPRQLRVYTCTSGGTSASTGSGPTGTGTGISDGSVTWDYTDVTDRLMFQFDAGATDWRVAGGRSENNGPILARFSETSSSGPVTRHKFEYSFTYRDDTLILDVPPKDGTYAWPQASNSPVILTRRGVAEAPLRRIAGCVDTRLNSDKGADGVAVDGLCWLVGEASARRLGRQLRRVVQRRAANARIGAMGVTPNSTVALAMGCVFDVSAGGQLLVETRLSSGTSRRLIVAVFDSAGTLIAGSHGGTLTGFRATTEGALTFYDTTSGYLGAYRQNTDGVGLDVVEFYPVADSGITYAFVGIGSTNEVVALNFLVPNSDTGIVTLRTHYGPNGGVIRSTGTPSIGTNQTIDEGELIYADRPFNYGALGWVVTQGGTLSSSGTGVMGSPTPAAYRIQDRSAVVFDSAHSGGYGTLTEGKYITLNVGGVQDVGMRVDSLYALSEVPAWATSRYVYDSDWCTNSGELYISETTGVTGVTAPTHTGGTAVSDGTITWRHVANIASPSGGTGPLHSVAHLHKPVAQSTARATVSYTTSLLFSVSPIVLTGELASHDPANLAAGASSAAVSVTVTGAALGDQAIASFSLNPSTVRLSAAVTATDTVSVIFTNLGGSPVDLASGTIKVKVFKQ